MDGERLQPQDIRKLLLDILSAYEFPLVVPDEAINEVYNEICSNNERNISYVEFKTFFVFLHDDPLGKLFAIITNDKVKLSKKKIGYSRLVTIKPVQSKPDTDDNKDAPQDNANADANADADAKPNESKPETDVEQKLSESEEANKSYYDRNKWKSTVQNLIPEATQIFVYFLDGYQILALAIGDSFNSALAEPAAAELKVDDVTYLAHIRPFDINNDMFPPITRSGGIKSKVARKIADSYIIARQWDEKHLKLVEKTGKLAHNINIKWTAFDEKYQLTKKLSAGAKQFDDKFGIIDKLGSVADKISSNEKVQIVSDKVNKSIKAVVKTVDDIGTETQQLVQEKIANQSAKDNKDNNNEDNQQNEGGQKAPVVVQKNNN